MTDIDPSFSTEAHHRAPSRTGLVILIVCAALLTVLFLTLGTWQVKRLQWKLDLIARIEARAGASPVPAPAPAQWAGLKPADYEYTRVFLSGSFENALETQVYTVTDLGPGYWVLTPFKRDDGSTVFVNRGFVPSEKREPSTRRQGQLEGPLTVNGLMRKPDHGNTYLRKNDPAAGKWYSRDINAMASASSLEKVAPFIVDADATPNPGELPVGGLTRLTFTNNHLVYATTWYVLAGMVIAGAAYAIRSRGSQEE